MTTKYDTILLGNMSNKSVISNNKKGYELSDIDKDYLQRFGLFKFRTCLIEKCKERKVNFYLINEYCTSITCSNCGFIDRNLGGAEIYKCKNEKCNKEIDRDVNASCNIYIYIKFDVI